jgi:hypothetical protein
MMMRHNQKAVENGKALSSVDETIALGPRRTGRFSVLLRYISSCTAWRLDPLDKVNQGLTFIKWAQYPFSVNIRHLPRAFPVSETLCSAPPRIRDPAPS